ncbi:MAG: LLM class flavin-dependent oxidoreductase [Actinomycetota bacterium]
MSASRRVELSVGLRNFSSGGTGRDLAERFIGEVVALDMLARESGGVDRVVVSDHVLFGEDLSAYGDPTSGGLAGGRQPTGPDGLWLEPLTLVAHAAAITDRIRFGTGIVLAALRRPVVIAKALATLDVLSDGRIDLGVGVGWQRAEYEAAGLDFAERGSLLDDTLRTCVQLWTGEPVSLPGPSGPLVVQSRPSPLVMSDGMHGVPIWVSGSVSGPVVRRTARFGVGWIPWGAALTDPVGGLVQFRTALARELDVAAELGTPTPLADAASLGAVAAVRIPAPERVGDLRSVVQSALVGVPRLVEAGYNDLRLSLSPSDVPVDATIAEVASQLRDLIDR